MYHTLCGGFSAVLGRRLGKPSLKAVLIGGAAAAVSLLAPSASWAQTCGTMAVAGFPVGAPIATGVAVTNSLVSSITAANTAFLTQSTAFVGTPPSPSPDSQGGGLWIRGVGGDLNVTAGATGTGIASGQLHTISGVVPVSVPLAANCVSSVHEDFAGFQLGQDISRLNVGGWNIHLGATAGYMETRGSSASPQSSIGTTSQIPFIGSYAVATNGGFFVDGIIRFNDYQTTVSAPGADFFDQKFGAHGITIAGSIGYNWNVPNSSWFIEPSAGLVWSHVEADPIAASGPVIPTTSGTTLPGTLQISDITSTIGRAGVRFGTTIRSEGVVWQPFAAASVWHEFGNDSATSFTSCVGCGVPVPVPPLGTLSNLSVAASLSTQNMGTFGQYSVGFNAQVENTGWIGFTRIDYRNGDRIEGWSGTAGLRYQFNPTATAAAMPVKAPVYKAPPAGPSNWTGFYAGVLGGGALNEAHLDIPAAGVSTSPRISGVLGGSQVGYNYQTGAWVLGVEADAAWTNASGSRGCAPLVVGTAFFNSTCHDEVNWLATVTGRLGYSWDRALFYGKAGVAFARESVSATCNFGPTNVLQPPFQQCLNAVGRPFDKISAGSSRVGWTIGYGVEYALTNHWSAKGELDYIDFGSESLTAADGTVFNASTSMFEGKIGLNYRF
jgi:opacity protein-like surface antigen